ncbi:5-(carboxyamino)imidazole ribonucleotide mutase [Methanofollis fontis]|uniref:N5-carboxyaminoimidazole ribonucleotide mutase n=1 Tax=Methanofollis fontis TaxID=2052832 RepID=A0A483CVK2_9EURY|nr:5-(carboxyamino)imidazole ribonucleotide mutase [Methanofollis fontis]TAJ45537.1 5-(carboxyamino)imidazole ribonucleotide mutase [Methanofollis fontis]
MPDVAIITGSASDAVIAEKAVKVLEEYGISHDMQVISAHRDPDRLDDYIASSDARIFICIAGMAAALPGVVASKTKRPVIGVPVSGTLMGGLDALLSIVQMPRGVPVACVAVDGGENAAHLAARILGVV